MIEWSREVQDALAAPFAEDEIEFRAGATGGGRALALIYVDARKVMNRLDAVVGMDGWEWHYEVLTPDCKKVKGVLTVLGVTKCDAGEASAEDEPLKSAVSDALKRAAIHFGIFRYGYELPQMWVPYDPQKKRFTETPRLPAGAVERALALCGYRGPMPPAGARQPGAREEQRREHHRGAPSREGQAPAGAPSSGGGNPLGEALIAAYRMAYPEKEQQSLAALVQHCGEVLGRVVTDTRNLPQPDAERCIARWQEMAGERAGAPPGEQGSPVEEQTSEQSGGSLICSMPNCGKPLTKGAQDVSMRAFGRSLCPACQRQAARTG